MRGRPSLLDALLMFKALEPRISVNEIIAFLFVCEREGLSIQEFANLAGLTQSTASRSLRALGAPDTEWAQPPALGLVDAYLHPDDARSHVVHLSARGRELRDELNQIIGSAVTFAG